MLHLVVQLCCLIMDVISQNYFAVFYVGNDMYVLSDFCLQWRVPCTSSECQRPMKWTLAKPPLRQFRPPMEVSPAVRPARSIEGLAVLLHSLAKLGFDPRGSCAVAWSPSCPETGRRSWVKLNVVEFLSFCPSLFKFYNLRDGHIPHPYVKDLMTQKAICKYGCGKGEHQGLALNM